MESSVSIKALAESLAKAQASISGASKNAQNPHLKNKYADLSSVVDAVKPALAEHGLSFVQVSHDAERAAVIETIILHQSGEWLSAGRISVPVSKTDAQGYGSALTYARRYGLMAAFGVAPEDDDGNAAANAAPSRRETKVDQSKAPKPMTESELEAAINTMRESDNMEFVKGIFGGAWKRCPEPMRERLQKEYNSIKAELEQQA